ncbi:MAG: glycosyltransferase [Firmicutes bacterium]|nr:glycosyltransferase [Bacillota bacterium]
MFWMERLNEMKRPTISLCMIVKDEEENLKRCLDSVKGLVNEIILVDTGSTDNTLQIAQAYGAKIINYKWVDDFSKARNKSLAAAGGDWILYLDADEELPEASRQMLKKIINAPDIEGYFFQVLNYTGKKRDYSQLVHQSCRLFRNRLDYQFQGKIHEQILPSIYQYSSQTQVLKTDLKIIHYGYMSANSKRKEKLERNIRILNKELERFGSNSFLEYHLGLSYYELVDKKKALAWFKKAYSHLERGYSFSPTLIRNIGLCLFDLQEYSEVIGFIDYELDNYPDYTDLYYLKGLALLKNINYSQAIKEFEHCLLIGEVCGKYTTTVGVGSFLAHYNLANAYKGRYEREKAIKHYRESLSVEPDFLDPLYPLTKLLKEKYQNPAELISYLETEFDLSSWQGFIILADLCASIREDALAANYLARVAVNTKLPLEARLLYAKSQLALGRYNQVYRDFTCLIAEGIESETFIIEYFIAYWLKNSAEGIDKLTEIIQGLSDQGLKYILSSMNNICCDNQQNKGLKNKLKKGIQKLINKYRQNDAEQKHTINDYQHKLIYVLEKILRYNAYELFDTLTGKLITDLGIDEWEKDFIIGEIYYKYDYYNEASREFLKSLDNGGEDDRLYYYLGRICEKRELLADAENLYCYALNNNERLLKYHLAVVRVALKRAQKISSWVLKERPEAAYFLKEEKTLKYLLGKLG